MKVVYLAAQGNTVSTRHEVPDITRFLMQQFGHKLPSTVRIYHRDVSLIDDVTPGGGSPVEIERQIRRLRRLPGPFYVVQHPGDGGFTLGYLIAAVIVASVAAAVLLRPKMPNTAAKNRTLDSPNNSLSERTNEARINGRVPDIVGNVRSTPDLLGPPYFIYVDNVKREVAYMCIGRGSYEIHDLRDDTTPIAEISGASAEVYGPYTSPNSGSPQIRVGDPIGIPLLITKRIDSVNGQTLIANDAGSVVRKPMRFQYPNQIISQGGADFTEVFVPGDVINVSEAAQAAGTFSYTVPNDEGRFTVQPSGSPSWGEMAIPGDRSGDWAIGQFVTMSNATVEYQYEGGGDAGPILTGRVNLNGMYPILNVTYIPYSAADPDNSDLTVIRFDVSSNSSAWRTLNDNMEEYAIGNPTLTRPSTVIQFDLSGTYTIVTVTSGTITLNNPEAVNPAWITMANDYGGLSDVLYPVLSTSGNRWVGWFTVRHPREINRFIINIVSSGGLYAIDEDGEQRKRNVAFRIEAQRVDDSGNPFGTVHTFERVLEGSATTQSQRALTVNEVLVNTPNKNWRFRVRRLTPTDHDFGGTIVDEIIWNDLYVASNVPVSHFGDVTTVYTVTSATAGATAMKSRKFNSLVTRKIPLRISGDEFTTDLHPTKNAAEILSFLCLDPVNGRRTKSQVDFDSIYSAHSAVVSYFGTSYAGEFCYTFDNDAMSFEEMASSIAQWIFCQAYRRGSKIKLFFERQTDHRAMLFNHRNVLPGTEEHSGSFGYANSQSHDGVQFQWMDPSTDATATITLPSDGSALNPIKIESIGVRNHIQAHFHAWREYQKIMVQRRSKTFDALHMANLLIPKNVVLCTDGTRPESVTGEVVAANGLVLELDQEIDWSNGSNFYIFLQVPDVTVDAIPVSPGPNSYSVTLSRAPAVPVSVGGVSAFNTSYAIISTTNQGTLRPYIVAEKSDKQNMTVGMQVVEYSDAIYIHDKDFINGIIE